MATSFAVFSENIHPVFLTHVNSVGLLYIILILVILIVLLLFFQVITRRKEHRKYVEEFRLLERELYGARKYARKILNSILPTPQKLKQVLGDYFVYYKPKDQIGGDFYWAERVQEKALFSVMDYKGDGIPGVLVSLIAYEGLNRALTDYELTRPDKIVSALNEYFSGIIDIENVMDGKDALDVGIAVFNRDNYCLDYCGAGISLFIVRKSGSDPEVGKGVKYEQYTAKDFTLFEILPDVKSVKPSNIYQQFSNNRMFLQSGDYIYLFSSGLAVKGEKEHIKIRDLLISLPVHDMEGQKKKIENYIQLAVKNREQAEDITFIGLKIK